MDSLGNATVVGTIINRCDCGFATQGKPTTQSGEKQQSMAQFLSHVTACGLLSVWSCPTTPSMIVGKITSISVECRQILILGRLGTFCLSFNARKTQAVCLLAVRFGGWQWK
jgi:hypothetical protein